MSDLIDRLRRYAEQEASEAEWNGNEAIQQPCRCAACMSWWDRDRERIFKIAAHHANLALDLREAVVAISERDVLENTLVAMTEARDGAMDDRDRRIIECHRIKSSSKEEAWAIVLDLVNSDGMLSRDSVARCRQRFDSSWGFR